MLSRKACITSFFLWHAVHALCAPTAPSPQEARQLDVEFLQPSATEVNLVPSIPRPIGMPPEKEIPKPRPVPPNESQEFVINLKNPVFSQGVIKTDQGGVITGDNMRIQALKIEYTNRIENGNLVKKVVAEGDLLLEYGDQAFVGRRLEYDFVTKSGTLWDGKTYVSAWFLGGDKIELKEDGTYLIYNAYITTCESQEKTWDINAGAVEITKEHLVAAKNIQFRFSKIPLFWIPAFRWNLKTFKDPPVRYKVTWDKGLGPRLTMRYRVYSWEKMNVFFRFDYRLSRGPGAALEGDYHSLDNRTVFIMKNYGAYDKSVPDETNNKRYRLQGMFDTRTEDSKTQLHLQYDKMSDDKMPGDFRSDDFEVNTQKRTFLLLTHRDEDYFAALSFQPQINPFQSVNQELPYATIGNRSWVLGNSGIISENVLSGAYLDYTYSTNLYQLLHNLRAGRLETLNRLYRPIPLKYFTLTPSMGFVGIFYSNSPHHDTVGQAIFTYGLEGTTRLLRHYDRHRHQIEPYFNFQGYTAPTSPPQDHFFFNLDDGYERLSLLRFGVRNTLYSPQKIFLPTVTSDLYSYAFLRSTPFHRVIPKAYLDIGWNLPSISFTTGFAYNIQEVLWDFNNIRAEWTVNEDIAIGAEFRHRSKYDWRKGDHYSFFLEAAHSIPDLLDSPLSDGRDTLLTRMFIRLSPKWSMALQSHHGWGRRSEPRYNEYKIDLFTLLTCSWRLRVSYEHMPNDDRFSSSLSLVK